MPEHPRSKSQTLEQRRAGQAWEDVKKVTGEKRPEIQHQYRSLARSLPADIIDHGLGQALLSLRAKAGPGASQESGKAHDRLYRHVSRWLCGQLKFHQDGPAADLLVYLSTRGSRQDYRRAAIEALAYARWLKGFAEALLEEGKGQ